ncbi:hypothetical protein D3C87_1645870 [compost metagenome]
MPCIAPHHIRVSIEIAGHAVHFDTLLYIARYDPVVITFFQKILVVVKGTFIGKAKCPFHIAFNGIFVGRQGKEQLVKTPYVLSGFHRTVDRGVLSKCEHERFAIVQHINFLALLLGETIGSPKRVSGH